MTIEAALRDDFANRGERPIATTRPTRNSDSSWLSPDGDPVTSVVVIGWTRPREQDGVAITAYYAEASARYWVHEGGGISGYDEWFGPFQLSQPPGKP